MPITGEELLLPSKLWVTVGSAAAIVGATFGATAFGAYLVGKKVERMSDPSFMDSSVATRLDQSSLDGGELPQAVPGRRTRLNAQDVLSLKKMDTNPGPPK